ncbi:hypothetical protein [Kitasatospora sp. NPDC048407]|uniref:hypothetical protein n=1 Tax=Kitasatospora sp. NPDC048407 TaxID=3364051 RepID=UPI00371345BA
MSEPGAGSRQRAVHAGGAMIASVVLGLIAALALPALAHWYLWRRPVCDVSAPDGWCRRAGTVLAVLLPLLAVGALVGGCVLPLAVERWLAWPGYLWRAVLGPPAVVGGEATVVRTRVVPDRRARAGSPRRSEEVSL